MRGANPIVYPARMASKRLKRVIRDEPEIHPGNLEERRLFLTVSLGDLPMYPNIAIGFFSTSKAKPHKGDTSQAKNPYSLQKIVFNCPKPHKFVA